MACLYRCLLLSLMALSLIGCTSTSTPWIDIVSAVASEKMGNHAGAIESAKLNPAYRYLRVQAQGQAPALMVLGYVEPDPLGDIQVWYSSQREVIKLQNGRIVSTTGLQTNWRAVRFLVAPPAWPDVPSEGVLSQRLRDEMPGHRYALSDRLQLKPLAGLPIVQLPVSVPLEQANIYRWFIETTLSSGDSSLPPSWFAWGVHRGQPAVVYSQQCLSANFCLTLQLWPAQEASL
jgi:hypothetical protein